MASADTTYGLTNERTGRHQRDGGCSCGTQGSALAGASSQETPHSRAWRRLEWSHRLALDALLRLIRLGKTVAFDGLKEANRHLHTLDTSDPAPDLSRFASLEYGHIGFIDALLSPAAPLLPEDRPPFDAPAYETLEQELAVAFERLTYDTSPAAFHESCLVYGPLIGGVLNDSLFEATDVFWNRQGLDSVLRERVESLRESDSRKTQRLLGFLKELLRTYPELWDEVEGVFNRIYLPMTAALRDFRAAYLDRSVGIVPNELVTHAVGRLVFFYDELAKAAPEASQGKSAADTLDLLR